MTSEYRYVPVYPTIKPSALLPRPAGAFWSEYPDSGMAKFWCFSGRVALFHGLHMLDVRPGSRILMPNYFQGTEMETLRHYGLHLHFYKVKRDLTIDFEDVAATMPSPCSAFYIIHYFGHPHPMEPILDFCRTHKLLLIEDCAVAMLSKYRGRWLGAHGDLAIYSPYKSIGMPHGGLGAVRVERAVFPKLQPPPLLSTMLQIRDRFGRYLKASAPRVIERSFSALSAAVRHMMSVDRSSHVASGSAVWSPSTLGLDVSRWARWLARAQTVERVIKMRRYNYLFLAERLPNHIHILWRSLADDECPLFLPLIVEQRDVVQKMLRERGVESVAIWSDAYADRGVPVSDDVAYLRRSLLEIPIHQGITQGDLDHMVDVICSVRIT